MSAKLEEITTLEGHTGQCWGVAFHPTQPLLASCSSDKSIRLYGFTKALSKNTFHHLNTLPAAHNRTIRQIAFSPDGRRMASASFDSTVGIWERTSSAAESDQAGFGRADSDEEDDNAEEWENVGSLEGHESEVKSVAWSYDGSLLATCGRDKSVWIWDANTPDEDFECLAVLMDHGGDVKHVTFSPKEEILASSSYDETVKLYAADYTTDEWAVTHSLPPTPPKHYDFPNAPEPEPDESGTGHSSTVWASSFSPCGNYIATCSDDLSIKIWARFKRKDVKGEPGGAFRIGRTEKEGWYCALTIANAHTRSIFGLDWSEAGNWTPELQESEVALGRIASAGGDGKISVYGIASTPQESQRCGYAIKHQLLASVEDAHGVYDINHVQWCRLGKPVPTLSAERSQEHRHQPTILAEEEADTDMEGAEGALKLREGMWEAARNMLATAADDGTVKVWSLDT